MDFRIILRRCLFPLRAHIIGLVYIATFLHTIYFAHLHTSLPYTRTPTNLHTYTQPILQTHLHHTYLSYPYIPTLHTYTAPTNLQNPTYLPYPYTCTIPTITTPYSACLSYHYTPAPRAGSHMVRLRSASDGILRAAKFIGEIIAFEFD